MSATKKANVLTMPAAAPEDKRRKTVRCRQEDIDALPYGSGDWSVEDVPGLILRCGAKEKSFRLQRRIHGRLVKVVLGPMSAAEARRQAMKHWAALKPRPAEGRMTLRQAFDAYLAEKPLAKTTCKLYRYTFERYFSLWAERALEDIGRARLEVRAHYHHLRRRHGKALASMATRMFRAVYNYARRGCPDLPPCPTEAVDIDLARPRDWALSPEELRAWWTAVQKLNRLKQTFWLTVLLTGARRGSVEALRWRDVNLDAGRIHFSTAKAGRTYAIPACRRLVGLLRAWREDCPPTEAGWVFPSPQKPEAHIVAARDDKRGVASAHHLRHTYRTMLAELGATPDQARLLLGHSLSGDVSRGYITPHLLVESLRPLAEAVAEKYAAILGWE